MKVSFLHHLADKIEFTTVRILRSIIKIVQLSKRSIVNTFAWNKAVENTVTWWQQQIVFQSTDELFGHLDSIVAIEYDDVIEIIIKGWLLHPSLTITGLMFPRFETLDAISITRLERKDVRRAFPTFQSSIEGGFVYIARIPHSTDLDTESELDFSVQLSDERTIHGTFEKYRWAAWPQLPWEDRLNQNIFVPSTEKQFQGARIKISEDTEQVSDSVRLILFSRESCKNNSKEAPSSSEDTIISGKEDFQAFLSKALPLADEIIFKGDYLKQILVSISEIWIGNPRCASLKFE